MISEPQICQNELKILGKLNRIAIEIIPKSKLRRTRNEHTLPFSATGAFFNSGTQVPAEISKDWQCQDIIRRHGPRNGGGYKAEDHDER